jgi:CheY-like chemotaxis protein
MDLLQKLAFVVQPNRLQGLIWQALLKSQNMSVILEAPNGELADCISQISGAGLTLPDLLILDAATPGLNPYEFCRWCRAHFPSIRVFLTRTPGQALSETERCWAQRQGAAHYFNGFNRDNLMRNAVTSLKEILTTLDQPCLDERALLVVLLNIRRQIGATRPGPAPAAPLRQQAGETPAKRPADRPIPGDRQAGAPGQGRPSLDWAASGLQAFNRSQPRVETSASAGPIPYS